MRPAPRAPARSRRLARQVLPVIVVLLLGLWLAVPKVEVLSRLYGPGRGYRAGILFSVTIRAKAVAITFDDGPSASVTPALLALLRRFSAKATFFVIGAEVERFPEVARRILAEGHEIGCHSFSHPYLQGKNADILRDELDRSEKVLLETLGVRPILFRFPGLSYDARLVKAAQGQGYVVVSCSLDSRDWLQPDPRVVVDRVVNAVRPGDIILMHDGDWIRVSDAVQSLAAILGRLTREGYRFVTVSRLLEIAAEESADQGEPGRD